MIFTEMIGDLVMALFFAGIVVGNMLRIIMLIKRLTNKEYCERVCRLNVFCHRYWADVTQEDVDCLTMMLNERRKELDHNDG